MRAFPAMSAPTLALYLRHIRLTRAIPALHALADEIKRGQPNDEATPRLLAVITVRIKRLASKNERLAGFGTVSSRRHSEPVHWSYTRGRPCICQSPLKSPASEAGCQQYHQQPPIKGLYHEGRQRIDWEGV